MFILHLVIIACLAFIFRVLAKKVSQPEVIGELILGVILGAIGWQSMNEFRDSSIFHIIGELGILLFLFEVGLETGIHELKAVGKSSFFVAIIGVVFPFFLGYEASYYFFPTLHIVEHLFVGATLTATSVGITAKVLKELNKLRSKEGRIILGAAVIDDILGLIVLAVVVGLVQAENAGESINTYQIGHVVLKSLGFVVLSFILLPGLANKFIKKFSRSNTPFFWDILSGVFLSLMCYSSWISGLSMIVGAFVAGAVIDHIPQAKKPVSGEEELEVEHATLPPIMKNLTILLLPFFFVRMGMLVDVYVFFEEGVFFYATILCLLAILGKQLSSLGVKKGEANRLAIGLGMIPRGEVGLIVAGIGATLKIDGHAVISPVTYAAVVIVVLVTTILSPLALSRVLKNKVEK